MSNRTADGKVRETRNGFILVFLGIALANVGVWRGGVPFDDESSHILTSLLVLKGQHTTNLYSLCYAALLGTIAPDPMDAYLVMRAAASVASTLGLFWVLRAFRNLRWTAIVISCLVWSCSSLCTPPTQNGNVCLFSLALMLPALGCVLRRPNSLNLIVFSIASFWTSQVRPEYLAPMIALPIGGIVFHVLRRRRLQEQVNQGTTTVTRRWAITLAVGTLVGSIPLAAHFREPTKTRFNDYLLLGLGQCYAAFYHERHPKDLFMPFTEYQPILDRVFGHPRSLTEAAANNPRELGRYLAVNGAINFTKIPRVMFSNRNKIYNAIILTLLFLGGGLGIRTALLRRQDGVPLCSQVSTDDAWRVLLLLLFASASSCAIVLLIPLARYWITWAPFFYLALAWCVHNILDIWSRRLPEKSVLPLAIAVFGFPVFFGVKSNRGLIDSIRVAESGVDHPPVVAGVWSLPISTFAFRDHAVSTYLGAGLTIDELRGGRCDVLVMDGLMETQFGVENRAFLMQLTTFPMKTGYRLLPEVAQYGQTIYVRSPEPTSRD